MLRNVCKRDSHVAHQIHFEKEIMCDDMCGEYLVT